MLHVLILTNRIRIIVSIISHLLLHWLSSPSSRVCTGPGKPGKSKFFLPKKYESISIVYHDRQKFHWMYFTELRIKLVMEKMEKVWFLFKLVRAKITAETMQDITVKLNNIPEMWLFWMANVKQKSVQRSLLLGIV